MVDKEGSVGVTDLVDTENRGGGSMRATMVLTKPTLVGSVGHEPPAAHLIRDISRRTAPTIIIHKASLDISQRTAPTIIIRKASLDTTSAITTFFCCYYISVSLLLASYKFRTTLLIQAAIPSKDILQPNHHLYLVG